MFNEFDSRLAQAIEEAGFTEPTDVQIATFDAALSGEDVFVSAETGSGKTAAYLLPIFEHLLQNDCDVNKLTYNEVENEEVNEEENIVETELETEEVEEVLA